MRTVAPLRQGLEFAKGRAMFKMVCLLSAKTAVAAPAVAAAAVATPVRTAAAETSIYQLSCTTMLRVVGVTPADVLFV